MTDESVCPTLIDEGVCPTLLCYIKPKCATFPPSYDTFPAKQS